MRPLRSFLLLLIFLACFTGLHYIISLNQLFPSVHEFVPAGIINTLISATKENSVVLPKSADTIKLGSEDTIVKDNVFAGNGRDRSLHNTSIIPEKASIPLQSFIDSLKLSRGQIRIIYYGDSQIERDRVTSYLRRILRKGR